MNIKKKGRKEGKKFGFLWQFEASPPQSRVGRAGEERRPGEKRISVILSLFLSNSVLGRVLLSAVLSETCGIYPGREK